MIHDFHQKTKPKPHAEGFMTKDELLELLKAREALIAQLWRPRKSDEGLRMHPRAASPRARVAP